MHYASPGGSWRGATVRLFTSLSLFSPLWSSCDADQKPLKEEMGALPGAGHLRVPRQGNKRVCRCHSRRGGSNQTRQPRKQEAAGGGVDINLRLIAAAAYDANHQDLL
jgi:hypothetical protein